jgi:hypothetical protein
MKKYISMAAVLLALAGLNEKASAQFASPLEINFVNSTTYSNDDVWFTFFTAQPFGGTGGTYTSTTSGLSADIVGGSAIPFTYSQDNVISGTTYSNVGNAYSSQSYNLTSLSSGINLNYGWSSRIYVSLGNTMAVTGTNGMFSFGTPTYTNPTDPNFGTKWDIVEIAYDGNLADQGDLSVINGYAIPMKVDVYANGTTSTPAQTRISTTNSPALTAALTGMAGSFTANNWQGVQGGPNGTLTSSWVSVNTSGEQLRLSGGPSNGAAAVASTTVTGGGTSFIQNLNGGGATIGPNPTFGEYVGSIGSTTTPITGTVGGTAYLGQADTVVLNGGTAGMYSATWVSGGNTNTGEVYISGSNPAIRLSGSVVVGGTAIGKYEIIVPPDTNPGGAFSGTGGTANPNYLQSAAIYHAALDSYGVIYKWTPITGGTAGTEITTLDINYFETYMDSTLVSQAAHDWFSGYNYGLIGSTVTAIGGTNYNDIGSAGWRTLGTNALLFSDIQPDNAYYNEWAALVYEYEHNVYGYAYSDFLQDPLFQTAVYGGTNIQNVDSLTITILPESFVIPEPSTYVLLLLGCGIFFLFRKLRTPKPE